MQAFKGYHSTLKEAYHRLVAGHLHQLLDGQSDGCGGGCCSRCCCCLPLLPPLLLLVGGSGLGQGGVGRFHKEPCHNVLPHVDL